MERARIAIKARAKARSTAKAKAKENLAMKKSAVCAGKRGHLARDCWSRANHDKMVNEVVVEDPNAEPDKEYVYTIEHEVNVVNVSQSGCGVNKIKERTTARDWDPRTHEQTARDRDPRTHESLVMVDSGASVNVCPKWFGNS